MVIALVALVVKYIEKKLFTIPEFDREDIAAIELYRNFLPNIEITTLDFTNA